MFRDPKILLVDDEDEIRNVLVEYLGRHKLKCWVAENGRTAWNLLRENEFDIVISDIKMPVMGGAELLYRIQKESPGTSVILMTAYEDEYTALDALRDGADDYITKPFALVDILPRIQRLLREKAMVTKLEQQIEEKGLEITEQRRQRQLVIETLRNQLREKTLEVDQIKRTQWVLFAFGIPIGAVLASLWLLLR